MEDYGLIVAEHVSVGDAEEKVVADLTSSTGYGYSHGFFGLGE